MASTGGAEHGRPASPRLAWDRLYREPELYRAAIRVYTKPLFAWRKALGVSTDGRTFYDFARRGLNHLAALHRALGGRRFRFRPGLARHYTFNRRARTIYLYPWEERVVDLLLYRLLARRLDGWFSPHSYAYRAGGPGLDLCQRRIAGLVRPGGAPLYLVKRDIADYYPSIDHPTLRAQVEALVEPGDYLLDLLRSRIEFEYEDAGERRRAARGIPFGTPIACLLANLHLTGLDRAVAAIDGVRYFRYADDLLCLAPDAERAEAAARAIDRGLAELRLASKPSHELDLALGDPAAATGRFRPARRLRHLGLEFRHGGPTGLSRDKQRKIANLFRYALRRAASRMKRKTDPRERARALVEAARQVLERGVRNVAIVDYYLRHVEDEAQLRRLDRWLAEEVLALATLRGHRKGNFRRLPFAELRAMGLPSLVHRHRLVGHGEVESSFFIWRSWQERKAGRGTAARRRARPDAFSPYPKAVAPVPPARAGQPVGEGGHLSTGVTAVTIAEAMVSFTGPSPGRPI